MIIGIDVDDTMTNTSELLAEYAKKYFNSNNKILIKKILHPKKADTKIFEFYCKYLPEMMMKYTLKENVKEVIDRLRLKGHKIIIITARGTTRGLKQAEITKKYFQKHKINVDKIIFEQKDKTDACLKYKIDIMVDDSTYVLESLKGTDTKPLLFVSINNKDFKNNFDNVSNWLELEKYIMNSNKVK